MKYDYVKFNLEDVTIDPDNPEQLKFDNRYASVYFSCLNKKWFTKSMVIPDYSFIKMINYQLQKPVCLSYQGICGSWKKIRSASYVKYQAKTEWYTLHGWILAAYRNFLQRPLKLNNYSSKLFSILNGNRMKSRGLKWLKSCCPAYYIVLLPFLC